MLLNRVLTVRPGESASHRGRGWEEVTERAIAALVERGGPCVAILWGRDAQSLKPMLGQVPWVESVHPSPLSASRGFFGSRPFSPGEPDARGAGRGTRGLVAARLIRGSSQSSPASWTRMAICTRLVASSFTMMPGDVGLDRGHAHVELRGDLRVDLALADRDRPPRVRGR